ncbi:hypothetical protein [Moorena sp. SIO3H5]|uniref:hypothetical protein n=1 Tax=Moorena sp. SIO3H5 TaxID=2607834 RepID=UPI0013B6F679|nr:hypothetical protein [Moorena sp. SIO3H5]NEO68668.1 hypothetical protein [Moorena sp. SIO3H5]
MINRYAQDSIFHEIINPNIVTPKTPHYSCLFHLLVKKTRLFEKDATRLNVGQTKRTHSKIPLFSLFPVPCSLFPKKNGNANIFFVNFTLAV